VGASYNVKMINCTRCGAQNPEGARTCSKCGIAFVHQFQAQADAKRAQTGLFIRIATWVVVLVVLAIVGPPAYYKGGLAYFKWKLNHTTETVMRACDGPADANAGPDKKRQIDQCLADSSDLIKAQKDYDNFLKPEDRQATSAAAKK